MVISLASKAVMSKSQKEIIGLDLLDVLYTNKSAAREVARKKLTQLFRTNKPQSWEMTQTEDNNSRFYSVTATPISKGEKVIWATVIISDVTNERNSQRNMLMAEQAKIASRSKTAFIASMSHETRNPLQAILASLQLLATTPLSQSQLEYVEDATENSKLLLAIISDVLDMSKIESGKLELDVSPFSVMDVIETTSSMISLQAYEKGLGTAYITD
jgi:signal transduction histidine kinase